MKTLLTQPRSKTISKAKPRLGFLGVGWIGRNRLEAVMNSGVAEIAAIADTSMKLADEAASVAPQAHLFSSLDELLETELDGIVIATPSALHAEQSIAALERGIAVFCQKPLGRNATETRRVVETAREANVLLGTDLSYRFVTGIRRVRELCRSGELGEVFAADLFFHNAYGPDKPWFYDAKLSGGGCLIDLGIHLADLGLWMLDFPQIAKVSGCMFAQGKPIQGRTSKVEDYAHAQIDLESGGTIRIACSWKLPAGCDAVISGSFYGTKGGAAFHNVNGSFYDFTAERFRGTKTETIASPPDLWPGRAAVDWAQRLANGEKFNSDIEHVVTVAKVLDSVYKHSCEEMDFKR
jgi:predicted dehydrogenase